MQPTTHAGLALMNHTLNREGSQYVSSGPGLLTVVNQLLSGFIKNIVWGFFKYFFGGGGGGSTNWDVFVIIEGRFQLYLVWI